MKLPLLTLSLACCFSAASLAEEQKKPFDPKSASGKYTFNPSETDEMAIVNVTIRKETKKEGAGSGWRADGTMDNSFHGTTISFKGAYVTVEEDTVTVQAQFFNFTLKGNTLEFGDEYQRLLYREVNGKLLKE